MKLTLDVENTTTTRDGKLHLDPFEAENSLTLVGMLNDQGVERIVTFDHSEVDATPDGHAIVQQWLEDTTVLICHNAAYDLLWLWESGFTYDGPVFDTMLAEYVLQRGNKEPLSLEACAERYELETKKQDTLKEYFRKGYSTRDIPHNELCEYLSADLNATQQLSDKLMYRLNTPTDSGLRGTVDLTNQVCVTLARIYQRGFAVDLSKLDEVKTEFEQERDALEKALQSHVRRVMGDTPINLNSPEQMSQVVFSRRMDNKSEWASLFDYTKTQAEFNAAVKANSTIIKKTKASSCPACNGEGSSYKKKKDGTLYKKANKCKECDARGYILTETNAVAGLAFNAPSKTWVSANGFSTGKDNLDVLIATAKTNKMDKAAAFLGDLKRLSAVSSYLSSFVDGIDIYTKPNDMLHVSLTQHITSTGRFSGRNPNMQNMPRGGTFPVKRVFVSRWEGGYILEADFAQLEFRAAAFLSQDPVAMEEINTGFDVHSYTAKVITDAGQPTTRQEAKEHTFAPLFGATGYGRSKAEAAYYTHFIEKYEGISDWHKRLADDAVRFLKITNVSGRQYAFPDVARRANGGVTHFTMIKNYPVQGFATGDVVPVVIVALEKALMPYQSCLVNTVHDSAVIDVHPDERDVVIQVIENMNNNLVSLIEEAYGITMNVPLLLEAKIGKNWLDVKDV